jgi:homoserine O-acetyltransferase/O-succinyltransferase
MKFVDHRATVSNRMKLIFALALAVCAASIARAEPQTFLAYDFEFENGRVLPELRVAYETHGTLNAGRDNAILLVHGASGNRHAFDTMIGPGKTFDTDKNFVITVDAIGGGGSSSPKDGLGQDFPRYTIRDMMRAQHALITRGIELATLRAVGGSSMGAFVGLEWGIHHPEMVRSLILLAPSPKADANFQLTIDLMTSIIALDPEWEGGRYTHSPVEGLRLAGMFYYPWTVSAPYIDRLPARQLAGEEEDVARSFADWDANSLVLRYAASRAHDISAPFGGDMNAALAQITAPTLILPSARDRLLGLDGARRIRDGIKQANYAEIPSDLGHRAALSSPETPEGEFVNRKIREFLAKVE